MGSTAFQSFAPRNGTQWLSGLRAPVLPLTLRFSSFLVRRKLLSAFPYFMASSIYCALRPIFRTKLRAPRSGLRRPPGDAAKLLIG